MVGDVCIEVAQFFVSGKLLPVGSINFCRTLSVVEPVSNFGSRRQTVVTLGWSQLCTAFVQYSLFSGLSTDDIRSFFSTIAFERTVFRDVQIAQSSVSAIPSVQCSFASVDSPYVQLLLDQRPLSPSTTADSSMHFVEDDIQLEDDSAPDQFISTSSATAISASIAALRESFSNLFANQSRDSRKTNTALSKVMCTIDHVQKVFLDSLAKQNETFQGLFKRSRQEAQNDNNALSLALKAVRTQNDFDDKLSDIRNELLEFHVDTQGQLASLGTHLAELISFLTKGSDHKKREDSSSHHPQHPPDNQSRPDGGGGSSGIEQMNRAVLLEVVLGKAVEEVKVREEETVVVPQKEGDLVAAKFCQFYVSRERNTDVDQGLHNQTLVLIQQLDIYFSSQHISAVGYLF
ncbi:hypothetical protein F511_35902 [Dorcoceras hygrometricum]|uniref:Uncharacterized protein n=1 Tax=Dorcoceras hygrometricum TaxID=472368 RepID=A0A2Z7DJH8_9LAMI|nr:hypothetical protein F511_35902 [Dorcoceras hygrometricum]